MAQSNVNRYRRIENLDDFPWRPSLATIINGPDI